MQEIATIRQSLTEMLAAGTFYLGRWHTNENYSDRPEVILGSFDDTMVLGLHWLPASDEFAIRVRDEVLTVPDIVSKRMILSTTASLYDPCGYIAPVIIVAKIIMQRAWKCAGVTWDAPLPEYLRDEWIGFVGQLKKLTEIRIPRWTRADETGFISLHGFGDASEQAYGGVVYLRVETSDGCSCRLIAAKSRIAPTKQTSIPRLELCAVELLSALMKKIKLAGRLQHVKATMWSDSIVALQWISEESRET